MTDIEKLEEQIIGLAKISNEQSALLLQQSQALNKHIDMMWKIAKLVERIIKILEKSRGIAEGDIRL